MAATYPLRFGLVYGQRAPWEEMVRRAKLAEDLGFDIFHVTDHLFGMTDVMDPTHEAYTMLAAIAPFTERIRLGVMVCGNTYRNPVMLLKQAVTVDHISHGRLDFGVGTGWQEREHEAYSFEFPSARELVDRFAEALEIWDLLQQQERTNYDGQYYQLIDAPFEPKPVQKPRLPVLIGASRPRMLRLTARHADIWNARVTPEDARAANERLDEECARIGRDPSEIMRGVSPGVNLLTSVEDFERNVVAYIRAGYTDFPIPWPKTDTELEVMHQAAENVIPKLR